MAPQTAACMCRVIKARLCGLAVSQRTDVNLKLASIGSPAGWHCSGSEHWYQQTMHVVSALFFPCLCQMAYTANLVFHTHNAFSILIASLTRTKALFLHICPTHPTPALLPIPSYPACSQGQILRLSKLTGSEIGVRHTQWCSGFMMERNT